MYIGIIDYDVLVSHHYYPNLDAMKVSTYHKENKDIVEMITDLTTWERYSKIYFFKNKQDRKFPNLFFSKARHKLELMGLAFSGGKYVPLKDEIEKCLPDAGIYDKILLKMEKKRVLQFKKHLGYNQVRIETNYVHINNPNSTYLIHDYDITNLPGLFDFLQNYRSTFVWTIRTEDLEMFINILSTPIVTHDELIFCDVPYYEGMIERFEQCGANLKRGYLNIMPPNANASFEVGMAILNRYIPYMIEIKRKAPKIRFLVKMGIKEIDKMFSIQGGNIRITVSPKQQAYINRLYPSMLRQIEFIRK